jgi:hypothetical protein
MTLRGTRTHREHDVGHRHTSRGEPLAATDSTRHAKARIDGDNALELGRYGKNREALQA